MNFHFVYTVIIVLYFVFIWDVEILLSIFVIIFRCCRFLKNKFLLSFLHAIILLRFTLFIVAENVTYSEYRAYLQWLLEWRAAGAGAGYWPPWPPLSRGSSWPEPAAQWPPDLFIRLGNSASPLTKFSSETINKCFQYILLLRYK